MRGRKQTTGRHKGGFNWVDILPKDPNSPRWLDITEETFGITMVTHLGRERYEQWKEELSTYLTNSGIFVAVRKLYLVIQRECNDRSN